MFIHDATTYLKDSIWLSSGKFLLQNYFSALTSAVSIITSTEPINCYIIYNDSISTLERRITPLISAPLCTSASPGSDNISIESSKCRLASVLFSGRQGYGPSGAIRTHGLLLPRQAPYPWATPGDKCRMCFFSSVLQQSALRLTPPGHKIYLLLLHDLATSYFSATSASVNFK